MVSWFLFLSYQKTEKSPFEAPCVLSAPCGTSIPSTIPSPHPAIRGSLPLRHLTQFPFFHGSITDGINRWMDGPTKRSILLQRCKRAVCMTRILCPSEWFFHPSYSIFGILDKSVMDWQTKKTNLQSPNTYNISYKDGKELILLLWYLQRWYYRPTDRQTDGRTDGRTDTSSCGDTKTHLKTLALFPRNG